MSNHRTSYRTHAAGELRTDHVGQIVKLAGWVHKKRDHGRLLFIDLRYYVGIVQCVIVPDMPSFEEVEGLTLESVIGVSGEVVSRSGANVNPDLATGEVEIEVRSLEVFTRAAPLPFPVEGPSPPEEMRLRHRYLDLRREKPHANVVLRSRIISSLRRRMTEQGFLEDPDAHLDLELTRGGA